MIAARQKTLCFWTAAHLSQMNVMNRAVAIHLRQRPLANSFPNAPRWDWRECVGTNVRRSVALRCFVVWFLLCLSLTPFVSRLQRPPSSPTADGLQLACCGNTPVQPQCVNNPACLALGLGEDCCPTVDNVFLDCCTAIPNDCQEPGSCDTSPSEASCELNPKCEALNLEGNCCPSKLPIGCGRTFSAGTIRAHLSHSSFPIDYAFS